MSQMCQARLQAVDRTVLTPLVRQALANPMAEVLDWEERLLGGSAAQIVGRPLEELLAQLGASHRFGLVLAIEARALLKRLTVYAQFWEPIPIAGCEAMNERQSSTGRKSLTHGACRGN